jgi:hypothetical protein
VIRCDKVCDRDDGDDGDQRDGSDNDADSDFSQVSQVSQVSLFCQSVRSFFFIGKTNERTYEHTLHTTNTEQDHADKD